MTEAPPTRRANKPIERSAPPAEDAGGAGCSPHGPVVTEAWSRSVVRRLDDHYLYDSTRGRPPPTDYLHELELESRRRQVVALMQKEKADLDPRHSALAAASSGGEAARGGVVQFFRQPSYKAKSSPAPSPSRAASRSPSMDATQYNSLIRNPSLASASSGSVRPATNPSSARSPLIELMLPGPSTPPPVSPAPSAEPGSEDPVAAAASVWGPPEKTAEELLADPLFVLRSDENCQRLLLAEEEHTERNKWRQSWAAVRGEGRLALTPPPLPSTVPAPVERRTPSPSPPLPREPSAAEDRSPLPFASLRVSPSPSPASLRSVITATPPPSAPSHGLRAASAGPPATSKPIVLTPGPATARRVGAGRSRSPHSLGRNTRSNASRSQRQPPSGRAAREGSPIPGLQAKPLPRQQPAVCPPITDPAPPTTHANPLAAPLPPGSAGQQNSLLAPPRDGAPAAALLEAFEAPLKASPAHGSELLEFVAFSEAMLPPGEEVQRDPAPDENGARRIRRAREQYLHRLRQKVRLLRDQPAPTAEDDGAADDTDDLLLGDNNYHHQNVQFILRLFGDLWSSEVSVDALRCVEEPPTGPAAARKAEERKRTPNYPLQALGVIFESPYAAAQ